MSPSLFFTVRLVILVLSPIASLGFVEEPVGTSLLSCFYPCFPHNWKFPLADHSASYMLHADFLLVLFSDPEDGGDMFFRNVG
jgi:hypothetical protein